MDPIVFLFLSDLHLVAAGGSVNGADPVGQLQRVLARVAQVVPRPAFCVVGGDIADDGAEASYTLARDLLAPLAARGVPILAGVGNHDDRAAFRRGFLGQAGEADGSPVRSTEEVAGVRVTILDTTIAGQIFGAVDDEQIAWLEARLAEPAPRGHLVVLHHACRLGRPAPHPWFELRGAAALESLLARHRDRVLGVLAGHTHQANAAVVGGVLHATAPAVLYQIDYLSGDDLVPVAGAGFAVGVVGVVGDAGLLVHPVLLPG